MTACSTNLSCAPVVTYFGVLVYLYCVRFPEIGNRVLYFRRDCHKQRKVRLESLRPDRFYNMIHQVNVTRRDLQLAASSLLRVAPTFRFSNTHPEFSELMLEPLCFEWVDPEAEVAQLLGLREYPVNAKNSPGMMFVYLICSSH